MKDGQTTAEFLKNLGEASVINVVLSKEKGTREAILVHRMITTRIIF